MGTTVLRGPNGAGKTSVLEALAYLGSTRSFRGAPRDALPRNGTDRAVVRGELRRDGSPVLVEAEIVPGARSRILLNRQSDPGRRDLADAVPVTVFSPDDLVLVQGPPAGRRDMLDDALIVLDHRAPPLLDELDRVLRQRGALLRQAGGRATPEVVNTLDVWDERLARCGDELVTARRALLEALEPRVAAAHAALIGAAAGDPPPPTVELEYSPSYDDDLRTALARARTDDLRRGVSTVGPHRDDVEIRLARRPARTQASQGEQRSVALSLRLATHRLAAERRITPILLLDDVFSELDLDRSTALVAQLSGGQTLVTTATPLPPGVRVDREVDVTTLEGAP